MLQLRLVGGLPVRRLPTDLRLFLRPLLNEATSERTFSDVTRQRDDLRLRNDPQNVCEAVLLNVGGKKSKNDPGGDNAALQIKTGKRRIKMAPVQIMLQCTSK